MTMLPTAYRPATAQTGRKAKAARGPRLWRWLQSLRATRRQRLHLDRLDDRLLADIGLTRAEAAAEAARAPWDAPAHWQR